jgi:hypothetical protein
VLPLLLPALLPDFRQILTPDAWVLQLQVNVLRLPVLVPTLRPVLTLPFRGVVLAI